MYSTIYTELLKFKRSKMLLLLPISAAFASILSIYAHLSMVSVINWDELFQFSEFGYNFLVAPMLFAMFTGFLFAREYQENTINTIFCKPINRVNFLLSKIIVMIFIISVTFFCTLAFSILIGLQFKHEMLTGHLILKHVYIFFLMVLMHSALIPIAALVSMIGKNIIPAIVLGIIAVTGNFAIGNFKGAMVYPWTIPSIITAKVGGAKWLEGQIDYKVGIVSLVITFVLPLILSAFYFGRTDVYPKS